MVTQNCSFTKILNANPSHSGHTLLFKPFTWWLPWKPAITSSISLMSVSPHLSSCLSLSDLATIGHHLCYFTVALTALGHSLSLVPLVNPPSGPIHLWLCTCIYSGELSWMKSQSVLCWHHCSSRGPFPVSPRVPFVVLYSGLLFPTFKFALNLLPFFFFLLSPNINWAPSMCIYIYRHWRINSEQNNGNIVPAFWKFHRENINYQMGTFFISYLNRKL